MNTKGSAAYLNGASNLRRRSIDSPARAWQPLDDAPKAEDAGEKWKSRNELHAYWSDLTNCRAFRKAKFTPECIDIKYFHIK